MPFFVFECCWYELWDHQYSSNNLYIQVKQFCSSFIVILGDFNARSKSWWFDDDLTTSEGLVMDSLMG